MNGLKNRGKFPSISSSARRIYRGNFPSRYLCFALNSFGEVYSRLCASWKMYRVCDRMRLTNRDLWVRLMKIIEVKENKKQYLDLLLLADEQEDMVDRYLDNGKMYVLDDNGVKCECVITDQENDILEIKNIATVPEYQGKGYARALIEFIVNNYREQYAILQVGTGDSPLTIPFYEKCGFVRSHIISNFFIDNYDHPIYESGIQLVDMVYLQRPL